MTLFRKIYPGLFVFVFVFVFVFGLLGIALVPTVQAHLMPAERGTLNIQDDAVFMVLSLPVSAFPLLGLEKTGDGRLSPDDLEKHSEAILESVRENVTLKADDGEFPLVGLLISPEIHRENQGESMDRLIVLGRFNVDHRVESMRFTVGLFGTQADDALLRISAKRKRDGYAMDLELTPEQPSGLIKLPRYNL